MSSAIPDHLRLVANNPPEDDAELIRLAREYARLEVRSLALGYRWDEPRETPPEVEEENRRRTDDMHALAEPTADMRASTIAGLRAKAAILWSAEFSFIDPAEIRKAGPQNGSPLHRLRFDRRAGAHRRPVAGEPLGACRGLMAGGIAPVRAPAYPARGADRMRERLTSSEVGSPAF